MKKSIKKNYIYNLLYQVFLLITPVITTPYVSRVLGAEGIGQYSFTNSIVSYFVLFAALGFGYYAQREIAKYQGNKQEQSKIFWEIVIIRAVSVLTVLIVYEALILLGVFGQKYTLLMTILSLNIIAVAFDPSFLFQGNEEFGSLVLRNFLVKSASIICVFAFVKQQKDVWLYVLIYSVAGLVSHFSIYLYLPKMICKQQISNLHPLRHLKPTIILFIPTIATSVYTMLDKTMIGVITGSDALNGYYEQAEKLVKMSLTIVTSLGTVMIPRNSHAIQNNEIDNVKTNIYKAIRFVWFIGTPIMFGIIAVSDNFNLWFFGPGYEPVITLMRMLSPLVLAIGLSSVLGVQYLIPAGKEKLLTYSVIIGAISNFILNIILLNLIGIIGVAIASVFAETIISFYQLFVLRNTFSIKKILFCGWKNVISGVIMLVLLLFISSYLSSSILNTMILILIGILIYFFCLFVLKEDTVLDIFKQIKKKI